MEERGRDAISNSFQQSLALDVSRINVALRMDEKFQSVESDSRTPIIGTCECGCCVVDSAYVCRQFVRSCEMRWALPTKTAVRTTPESAFSLALDMLVLGMPAKLIPTAKIARVRTIKDRALEQSSHH